MGHPSFFRINAGLTISRSFAVRAWYNTGGAGLISWNNIITSKNPSHIISQMCNTITIREITSNFLNNISMLTSVVYWSTRPVKLRRVIIIILIITLSLGCFCNVRFMALSSFSFLLFYSEKHDYEIEKINMNIS